MQSLNRQIRRLRAVVTRTTIISTALLLISAFSCLSAVEPAQAAAAVRPWYEPVSVFHAPAGFDPATASTAELRKLGFPAKPTGTAALAIWRSAVSRIKHWEVPHPVPGTKPMESSNAPATGGGGFSAYTDQYWAGHQVPESNFGGTPISYAEAEWTVGKVSANSSYAVSGCRGFTAPLIAEWAGLGDNIVDGSGDIIQSGTFSCSASASTYGFWTEDFPNNPVFEGPAVSGGNEAYVQVSYNGNDTTTYFLENVTTGTAQVFTNDSPYVDESTVEFILEHPGGDGPAMPNYGTVDFSECEFVNGSGAYTLTTDNNKIIMDDGHGDSTTGGVSNGGFSVAWVAGT
jgi:hypothetical protein